MHVGDRDNTNNGCKRTAGLAAASWSRVEANVMDLVALWERVWERKAEGARAKMGQCAGGCGRRELQLLEAAAVLRN